MAGSLFLGGDPLHPLGDAADMLGDLAVTFDAFR
jgi:hypothetical protein